MPLAAGANESPWLLFLVGRLRVALRFAKDPRAASVLKELIIEAETRLAAVADHRELDQA